MTFHAIDREGQLWTFGFSRGSNPKLIAVEREFSDFDFFYSDETRTRAQEWTSWKGGLLKGVIVQYGGQTPLNLAQGLK